MAKSGTSKYAYETDNGNVFFCRTDDAAALDAIRGSEPTDDATENITFEFSKNANEVGCTPRHVVLVKQITDPNDQTCLIDDFNVIKKVIVLTKAKFITLKTGKSGTTVTYSGATWRVKRKVFEQTR